MAADPAQAPAPEAATGGAALPVVIAHPVAPRRNMALVEAAEQADRNMHVFRRGLAIRAARREGISDEDARAHADKVENVRRVLGKLAVLWMAQPEKRLGTAICRSIGYYGQDNYRRVLSAMSDEEVEDDLDRALNKAQSGDQR